MGISLARYQAKIAERDSSYIQEAMQGDQWKRDHDSAMRVMELEKIFVIIKTTVDAALRADNAIHKRSVKRDDCKEMDVWSKGLEVLLRIALKGVAFIERHARSLSADKYRDAAITSRSLSEVKSSISQALAGLEEMKKWIPPGPAA